MSEPKPIERHMRVAVDDAEVDRMLRAFEGQLGTPERRRGSSDERPAVAAPAPRRAPRWGWIAVGMAAAAAVGLWLARPAPHAPGPLQLAQGHALPTEIGAREDPAIYELDDGSRIVLSPRTTARVTANEGRRLRAVIASGRATFDVTPGGPRRWTVDAGDVRVEVVGTRFTVSRDAAEVRVSVERGHVRVDHPSLARTADLFAGDELRLPAGEGRVASGRDVDEPSFDEPSVDEPSVDDSTADDSTVDDSTADDSTVDEPSADETTQTGAADDVEGAAAVGLPSEDPRGDSAATEPPSDRAPAASPADWRARARRGEFAAAYAALGADGLRAASRSADSGELLLLADIARRSGHPREAEPLLRELSSREPDARAAVASFTLGRLLLDRGDARGAAECFEAVRASAGGASLREDATALEARARARASDPRASEVARAYLSAYPSGRHVGAMRAIVE